MAGMTTRSGGHVAATPEDAEIAQARLAAMRGQRGALGDSLHAMGVRLGLAYNGSFHYPSEDRSILECVIFPYYQLSTAHRNIVSVGCDWYAQGYGRMFARKTFTTLEPDPSRACYGADRHIVDVVGNLGSHFAPGSLDVIFLNGVIGWGLDTPADTEIAFAACHTALRKGGHFMIGWNDLPEHRPFRLETITSLGKFQPLVFPPLETSEHLVANEWRHTFSFFRS
jgi:SAM-dependent methyltransferase